MITSKLVILGDRRGHSDDSEQRVAHNIVIPTHNLALAALPPTELQKVVSDSKPICMAPGDVIYEGGDEIELIYFPVDAVVSSLTILEDGSSVEISMTGREGLIGLPALIGGGRALHWTRVAVGGLALRIPTVALKEVFRKSEAVHDAVMKAYRSLFTQICQRSVCNVRHTLLQRLCVWLLMMSDRVRADELPFTQEDIANRISVRRAGVSVAASMLQSLHAISYHRGRIVINDRDVIQQAACECYTVMAADFHPDAGEGERGFRRWQSESRR